MFVIHSAEKLASKYLNSLKVLKYLFSRKCSFESTIGPEGVRVASHGSGAVLFRHLRLHLHGHQRRHQLDWVLALERR